mmetsp:Transcript_104422/g.185691  ORF Transcript_104422/g.185691 Transcript_104422/m.185691 type:complete len:469 (-) Transcript_104422:15-1421(-)
MLPTIVKACQSQSSTGTDVSRLQTPPGSPPLKTEDLLSHFETDFSSFLDGFLADHTGIRPGPTSGTTLKNLAATTFHGNLAEIDFESRYKPSNMRTIRSPSPLARKRGLGSTSLPEEVPSSQTPSQSSSWRPGTSQRQTLEGERTGKRTLHEGTGGSETARRSFKSASGMSPPERSLTERSRQPNGKDSKDGDKEIIEAEPQISAREEEVLREREACESLRALVFGAGAEQFYSEKEKMHIFQQRRGTQMEVEQFCEQWCQLDGDNSGDVDLEEFVSYFNKRRVDRLLGMRCVRYLMPKVAQQGRPGSVTKEDMMKLLWLEATDADIEHMNLLFDFYRLKKISAKPPKMLKRKRREEMLDIFQELDRDKTGSVPFIELVDVGIADHSVIALLIEKYGKNRNGRFNREEFLEMLAPLGYRAHPSVKQVVCKDGTRMRNVKWGKGDCYFDGWLTESDYIAMMEHYDFHED